MVALAKRNLQNQRNQMGFRMVVLTDGAIIERPGGIEVTQRDIADTIGPAHPFHHLFHRAFRFAIGIGRIRLIVLQDWHALRLAIDSGRRGEYDFVHTMAHHCLQQHLHAVDIVVEVFQRLFHAFADQGIGRKMDDSLDFVLGKNRIEYGCIADIALIEFCLRMHRIPMPGLQVVDNHDLLALRDELMNRMRPDIAGPAAY